MLDLRSLLEIPTGLLSVDEAIQLTKRVARQVELWRPLASAEQRNELLYGDACVGVWVISWQPGSDTGFHDHSGARGAVTVAEGRIREQRPYWGRPPRQLDAEA